MRTPSKRVEFWRAAAGCVFLGLLLWVVVALAHQTYHDEFEETDTPNDLFASADAGADGVQKLCCLTFDDGPSRNTLPILEILEQYGAPATFFVTAQEVNMDYMPQIADIVAAGHQVALHSATHQYSKIYANTDAFWQDIKELRQTLSPYLDVESLTWLRFPGGSTNTISHKYGGRSIMKNLIAQAEEKGYRWIDWNVCGEDATASHPNAERILKNIKRDAEGHDTCVVLLHDTKATGETVKALPAILDYFAEQGYTFCTVERMEELQNKAAAESGMERSAENDAPQKDLQSGTNSGIIETAANPA